MATAEERFCFFVEWFDAQADLLRRYQLTFYPRDRTVEMYDMKNRRPFLKRSETHISGDDLYMGATVTIHSRQLKVIEFADSYTQKNFELKKARTLAMIKPDAYNHIGKILDGATKLGLVPARLRMTKLTKADAEAFYAEHEGKPFFNDLVAFMTSDVIVAVEFVGEDAVTKWRSAMGPTSTATARAEAPGSLRAMFGTDNTKNAVHGSDSPESAAREVDFFFGGSRSFQTTALFNNCSCCIIRPHCFKQAGEIIDLILSEGFEVSAMQLWNIEKAVGEEFLEVYKGVLPEYHDIVDQMCSGPAVVMEIRQEDAVQNFRKFVGPSDPEVAKHLRPTTLRARFGLDRVRNAVHCTDLTEDGLLEVEYFFNILASRAS